jgi:hypothetical protein
MDTCRLGVTGFYPVSTWPLDPIDREMLKSVIKDG